MYKWKYENLTLRKQKEASKIIGVTPQWLCNICGRKVTIRKLLAYCITKYISSEAEIEDFFDYVKKGE